jgi:putative transposase
LFKQALGEDELARIWEHVQQQKALGSSHFQMEIETLLARKVAVRPRGRPRLEDD